MIGLPTSASSRIVARSIPASLGEPGDERLERGADRPGHLARALRMEHRVRDAAHEVLAEPDLRVHHARAGEHGAVDEFTRWPAIVVDPMSIATPCASSW